MKINKYIKLKGLQPIREDEDGKVYKAIIYNNSIDRDNEMASNEFLDELALKIQGKPFIKDHEWKADNIIGEVLTAIVEGEEEKYIVAEVLVKDEEAIEKIEKGLYKWLSVAFECTKLTSESGVSILDNCKDAYELSVVVVPAVPKASMIYKSLKIGGNEMIVRAFKLKQLLSKYPSLKSVDSKELEELTEKELGGSDVELSEDDIKAIFDENEQLKNQLKELQAQLEEYKTCKEAEEDKDLILADTEKAVDELDVSAEVKEVIMEEVKEAEEKGDLVIEHINETEHAIKGLDKFIEKTKEKYTRLGLVGFKSKEQVVETKKTEMKSLDFTAKTKTEEHTTSGYVIHKVKKSI